eukprot:maker-scaffold129_size324999-snap-gene-1.20 protein:Tk10958 transcript:maker-scaffold129_size324999-snap-gene-1.20-mRNA-1 annotation:"snrna-activating protein complex subunit 1"
MAKTTTIFPPAILAADKDVESLLERVVALFDAQDGLRFEYFKEIWHAMKFPWIFHGHDTFRDLYEFTDELLDLVKAKLACPDHDFGLRAAALYALYSIYLKQPLKKKVRIRLTQSEFKSTQSFIAECQEEQHWDLVYCWCQLQATYALEYTGSRIVMGVETANVLDSRSDPNPGIAFYHNRQNPFKSGEVHELLGQINRTHHHYVKIRNALRQEDAQTDSGLRLVSEDLPEALEAITEHVYSAPVVRGQDVAAQPVTRSGNDLVESGLTIGDRRKKLIQGAFSTEQETSLQRQYKKYRGPEEAEASVAPHESEPLFSDPDEVVSDEESVAKLKPHRKGRITRGSDKTKELEVGEVVWEPEDHNLEAELARAQKRLAVGSQVEKKATAKPGTGTKKTKKNAKRVKK